VLAMMTMRNSDAQVAAPADGAARRYYGKYAGLVTDNTAPQGQAHHRGQIKVKVPGILQETSDGNDSQPIEVLAAPCFLPGFFFVPENQAQVWVEFVAGDINYPIWTGVWYPNDATPKAVADGTSSRQGDAPTLDQKIIRTSSGKVIQLDDTSGSSKLAVKDEGGGSVIVFADDGITIQFGDYTKIVLDSQSILLQVSDSSGSSGSIKVTSSQITLKTSPSAGGVTVTIDGSTMDVR
jgi:uncharacterized protein involved in type VI secretion and phage assembly